jgi:hypothetical protein
VWTWIAQSAPAPVDVNPWAQLGIASIVCALLFAIAWMLWKAHAASDKARDTELIAIRKEKDTLYEERIEREQYLSDRLAPLLADAVKILALVPESQRTSNDELRRIVERLQTTVQELRK